MSGIFFRRYRLLSDFKTIRGFLTENYSFDTLNSYLLPQFFEYAHTHPQFNHRLAHRFGIWQDFDKPAGIACYEMDVGECFLVTGRGYEFLLPEMLEYAQEELSLENILKVWVTDKETDKIGLLIKNGYDMTYSEPVRIFRYDKPFIDRKLPEGYSVISLEEENDFKKIIIILNCLFIYLKESRLKPTYKVLP